MLEFRRRFPPEVVRYAKFVDEPVPCPYFSRQVGSVEAAEPRYAINSSFQRTVVALPSPLNRLVATVHRRKAAKGDSTGLVVRRGPGALWGSGG